MAEYEEEEGLYWRPFGGNNIDQISGHCYEYSDIIRDTQISRTTILVDLGKFDNHQALGVKNSAAAVPDIRVLLNDAGNAPRALFITHSHPDHLNGIIHYLKAGYRLPPLYGGRYTEMILNELYDEFKLSKSLRPKFYTIKDGDIIHCGSLTIEATASSHTCFDSLGLIIKSKHAVVYHTGDMKTDNSTYFRTPTNLKRIRQLAEKIDFVVADFYGVTEEGFATREVETFKKLASLLKKSGRKKVFIPVYPTHPEMYIMAFLAALKQKKNVVFYGNRDFYTYLNLIVQYGISFEKLAKNRIEVLYKPDDRLKDWQDNYVVIGTFNDLENHFAETAHDSIGIITAKTFFNPLKGQLNARNIPFVSVDTIPELQGYGHGFLGDYEYLNNILKEAVFIPTHCPSYVAENFRDLADCIGMRLINKTPKNNEFYRLRGKECVLAEASPATWLVVNYDEDYAYFTEVWQKPTSGEGFLKRTISARRCKNKFKIYIHQRKRKGSRNGIKEIR